MTRKYPAVTIATGAKRCAAVGELQGRRILAAEAPALPLRGCTMAGSCGCRFRKYPDRREDEQGRRFGYGQERGAWYAGTQRRKSGGRRTKD